MKKLSLALLIILAVSVTVANVTTVGIKEMLPTATTTPTTQSATSAEPELKWEFTTLDDFPTVVMDDNRAAVGVIVGDFYPKNETDFWMFYTERTDTPFLLVSVAVDGKIIVLCEKDGVVCHYWPSGDGGGSSVLALTADQLKTIRAGKVLDLVFFKDKEFVGVQRSLEGFSVPATKVLAAPDLIEAGKEAAAPAPWELYEMKDPELGQVVLVYGPLEDGDVTLSWSSVGYFEQVVPIEKYTGAEIFFKPHTGDIVKLEAVYWEHNGKRTQAAVERLCVDKDRTKCAFNNGVSLVMTEQDLLLMQIDRTLVIEWSDKDGKRFTSNVKLGPKSYAFNNRIQQLMKRDDGGMHPDPHATT